MPRLAFAAAAAVLLVAMATPSFCLDALPVHSAYQLRNLFLHQVAQLSINLPGGTVCGHCLMVHPRHSSFSVRGAGSVPQMEHAVRSRGVPQMVIDRMRAIVFSNVVHFQLFQFRLNARVGHGYYETYIGAARRVNAHHVEFGVIKTWATASLVRKTTPVRHRRCKRRWFVKRCKSWTEHVPRGNTAHELRLIEQGLRHYAAHSARVRVGQSFSLPKVDAPLQVK